MKRGNKILVSTVAVILILVCCCFVFRNQLLPYGRRISYGISDFFRDFGLKSPADITRIDDLHYGDDKMQVLDVYYLSGTQEAQPTIISLHGGGYSYGSKHVYQYYCMNLAQRGFTVVNFSYRLAPKYKFPSQLEDTNSVLTYVCEHAKELHIDTGNIFFVGDSAGGHLNFQYSTAVTNPEYAALLNLQIPDFTLRATALNCGVYSIEDTTELIHYYFDQTRYADEMNIMKYVTEAFPPAFVMSATGDICLPYAEPLHKFLDETGIVNELHIYGDQTNKPPHVFHINIRNDMATVCNDDECAFFMRYVSK